MTNTDYAASAKPARPSNGTAHTIYECDSCGARLVGDQRCEDCGTFMRRAGIGGLCPSRDEPITINELLGRATPLSPCHNHSRPVEADLKPRPIQVDGEASRR